MKTFLMIFTLVAIGSMSEINALSPMTLNQACSKAHFQEESKCIAYGTNKFVDGYAAASCAKSHFQEIDTCIEIIADNYFQPSAVVACSKSHFQDIDNCMKVIRGKKYSEAVVNNCSRKNFQSIDTCFLRSSSTESLGPKLKSITVNELCNSVKDSNYNSCISIVTKIKNKESAVFDGTALNACRRSFDDSKVLNCVERVAELEFVNAEVINNCHGTATSYDRMVSCMELNGTKKKDVVFDTDYGNSNELCLAHEDFYRMIRRAKRYLDNESIRRAKRVLSETLEELKFCMNGI